MSYDMKESGKRIRRLRMEAGLTQEKVANALNIDQSFYGRIETGKKGCSVDLFVQLSALFSVSLDYLILGRCLSDLPGGGDRKRLNADIDELIDRLEKLRLSF